MKRMCALFAMSLAAFCAIVCTAQAAEITVNGNVEASAILDKVWAVLNSNLGVTVVLGFFGMVLTRIFAWKPEWKKFYEANQGEFWAAVKYAEKLTPEGRLNAALDYFLRLHGEPITLTVKQLNQCLEVAHTEAIDRKKKSKS